MSILQKSLNDYLSPRFIGLSSLVFLAPLFLLSLSLIFGGHQIYILLTQAIQTGEFGELNNYPWLVYILSFGVVKWLFMSMFYLILGVGVVFISLIISMLVLAFLTPFVIQYLHKNYYKEQSLKPMSVLRILWENSFIIIKFLLIFFAILPFLWFPFVINIPFFYLFYKFMLLDVGSNIMQKQELKEFLHQHFKTLFLLNLCFFCLSLIPFFGIFLQLFFVIYLGHFFFTNLQSKKELLSLEEKSL